MLTGEKVRLGPGHTGAMELQQGLCVGVVDFYIF